GSGAASSRSGGGVSWGAVSVGNSGGASVGAGAAWVVGAGFDRGAAAGGASAARAIGHASHVVASSATSAGARLRAWGLEIRLTTPTTILGRTSIPARTSLVHVPRQHTTRSPGADVTMAMGGGTGRRQARNLGSRRDRVR